MGFFAFVLARAAGWRKGRTNNVLLKKSIFTAAGPEPFRPECRTGEDMDFFRRVSEKGYVFIWCNEAVVYEAVPPLRWKRSFMLRRALLQGTLVPVVEPTTLGLVSVSKSVVAVLVYGAALPFALIVGQHRFMSLLVKLCAHIGKLLALIGLNPVKEPYVTE